MRKRISQRQRQRRTERKRSPLSDQQLGSLVFKNAIPLFRKFGWYISRDESLAMLTLFVEAARTSPLQRPRFPGLNALIATAIEDYLSGKADTLDRAFGLAPRRGRPPSAALLEEKLSIAIEVTKLRDAGKTRDKAIEIVSGRRKKDFDYVRDAYSYLKFEAKVLARRTSE